MIASVLTNKKYPLFPDLAGLKCVTCSCFRLLILVIPAGHGPIQALRIFYVLFFAFSQDDIFPATPFPDLLSPGLSNIAQNGNQGSILAYSFPGRLTVTGLIGALLTPYFRITDIRAWNPKSPILRGEKPALLFPFGWQIAVYLGWSKETKKACFGSEGFWGSDQDRCREIYPGRGLISPIRSFLAEVA